MKKGQNQKIITHKKRPLDSLIYSQLLNIPYYNVPTGAAEKKTDSSIAQLLWVGSVVMHARHAVYIYFLVVIALVFPLVRAWWV
jgi:hypothetical protein